MATKEELVVGKKVRVAEKDEMLKNASGSYTFSAAEGTITDITENDVVISHPMRHDVGIQTSVITGRTIPLDQIDYIKVLD